MHGIMLLAYLSLFTNGPVDFALGAGGVCGLAVHFLGDELPDAMLLVFPLDVGMFWLKFQNT